MKLRYRSSAITLFLALSGFAGPGGHASAHDDGAIVSRDEWKARNAEARWRLDQMRRERKHFVPPLPTPEDIADERSRRAFEDDSLIPGDIISTRRGLLMFRGSGERERQPGDFVPFQR